MKVKTTQIEKKYQTKSGEEKVLKIDYAKAADRIKQFREDCPYGVIKTTPTVLDDGRVMFEAFVKKHADKSESAEATGHSLSTQAGDKVFEKQETIAVARALANLGYLAGGEVASSEEMEEYQAFKEEKRQEQVFAGIVKLEEADSLSELKEIFVGLGTLIREPEIVEAKDKRKKELTDESS